MKSIRLKAHEVRGVLDGRQTQLRRVLNPQPSFGPHVVWRKGNVSISFDENEDPKGMEMLEQYCPYGKPGDRLWVRETWTHLRPPFKSQGNIGYRATDTIRPEFTPAKWKPSIHMPRWASRILLEITGIRVERLHDISEEDAIAEGILEDGCGFCAPLANGKNGPWQRSAVDAFRNLWESINGPGSWDANPWVWVIEFKRVELN